VRALTPAGRKKEALQSDYDRVFGTPEGRRVLRDLYEKCCAMRSIYAPGRGVAVNDTIHFTGRQWVFLYIYSLLYRFNPDGDERYREGVPDPHALFQQMEEDR